MSWTLDDLRNLDKKYAEEGVHVHQRPFRAAMDILGESVAMGSASNPEVKRIMDEYLAMIPEVESSWPGAGIGLIAAVDQVRKVVFPIVFGENRLHVWELAGFSSSEDWWAWCRKDRAIAASVAFSAADLHDLTMGLNRLEQRNENAIKLWKLSCSNLEDVANTLPTTFSHDTVIQPICMVAELAIKAALVWDGVDPASFRGPNGHNTLSLAKRMESMRPHRDDRLVRSIIATLPSYVASRYEPTGLKRLQVVQLALGVQFIAASTLRRISSVDLVIQMEKDEWPGPRPLLTCFGGRSTSTDY